MNRVRRGLGLLAALALGWGAVATVAAATAPATDPDETQAFTLSGFAKDFLLGVRPAASDWNGFDLADLRLKAFWRPAEKISISAAYELSPSLGNYAASVGGALPRPDATTYRAADLGPLTAETGSGQFALAQNLDRLYVSGSFGFGDLTLGRQAVAFGSAKVVNPTDVLAPFTFQTLDKEERTGVDAVRLRIPWQTLGELDAGWVAGHEARADQSAFFVKPKIYLWETDVTGLLMRFRDQALLGLDLARAVGGASVWLETAYVWAGAFTTARLADQDYLRLSAGADYNLADGLYAFVEYHFNGAGAERPAAYLDQAAAVAYTRGGTYLLGRHYLAPGVTYEASPLLSVSATALWNLEDGSAFVAPAATYSLADNLSLVGGVFAALGRAPAAELRSEFGAYPDLLYLELKCYF